MKNFKHLIWGILLCLMGYSSFAQSFPYCSPTESWLPLPGDPFASANGGGEEFTEMNGILYMLYIDITAQTYKIASWDGSTWADETDVPIGGFVPYGFTHYNNELYVGGGFSDVTTGISGGNGIIRWNGTQWNPVGTGVDAMYDMAVYNGELYVGGSFTTAGGVSAVGIAKWNGTSWSDVGGGLTPGSVLSGAFVYEFIEHNGNLIAGGHFTTAGGVVANNIAEWDGTNWTAMGLGTDREISAMGIYNGDLIAYGFYINFFDGDSIHQAARWDGTDWYGMGFDDSTYADLRDFQMYNGELYAAGAYTTQFYGQIAEDVRVIRYDGTQWHPVSSLSNNVRELTLYQGRLYAIGAFYESGCGLNANLVARLCTQGNCGFISGTVFKDDNNDCIQDPGEISLENRMVKIDPFNLWVPTDTSGNYQTFLDTGNYTVSLPPQQYYNLNCNSTYSVALVAGTNFDTLDFAMNPIPGIEDLRITLTGGIPRPGFAVPYYLSFKNIGTEPMTGTVELVHDSILIYDSTSIAYASYLNQTLEWSFSNLQVDESQTIVAWFTVPADPNLLGDSIYASSAIFPILTDEDSTNNRDSVCQTITGSYDPNDKSANPPGGEVSINTQRLTYTIRFQNTGTDTAFTVVLKDSLSANLNLETLELLSSSHPFYFNIEDGRTANWVFENILLPDSNANEAASHGFVKYQIDLVEGLELGDYINNRAAIYFDFNPPIITNTVSHVLVEPTTTGLETLSWISMQVFPNPAQTVVTFEASEPWRDAQIKLMDASGRVVRQVEHLEGNSYQMQLENLPKGVYLYELRTKDGKRAKGKLVIA